MWVFSYYSGIVAKAFRDARGFLRQHLVPEALLVVAGLIVSAFIGGISLIPMLLPFAVLLVFACIVVLGSLVLAPARLNREKERELANFASPVIDVTTGFPVWFKPDNPRDEHEANGAFFIIPNVSLANTSTGALDLDIDLRLSLPDSAEATTIMMPLEDRSIPDIERHLNRWQLRGRQLAAPLRVEAGHRELGYLAFLVDNQMAALFQGRFQELRQPVLELTDAMTHVVIAEVDLSGLPLD